MNNNDIIFEYSSKIHEFIDSKNYEKALFIANESLKLFPNEIELLDDKLTIFIEIQDYVNAIEYYDKILDINPEYWNMLRGKASCYAKLNDLNNAIKTYNQALSLYIDDYCLIEEKIDCLFKFNQIEEANKEITNILSKYPDDPILWNIIGNIYSDNNENYKAIECYDKALDIELDSTYMENKLGSLLEIHGFDDNSDITWELFQIIQKYYSKFISDNTKVFFGPCKGRFIIDFKSVNEYLEFHGITL